MVEREGWVVVDLTEEWVEVLGEETLAVEGLGVGTWAEEVVEVSLSVATHYCGCQEAVELMILFHLLDQVSDLRAEEMQRLLSEWFGWMRWKWVISCLATRCTYSSEQRRGSKFPASPVSCSAQLVHSMQGLNLH